VGHPPGEPDAAGTDAEGFGGAVGSAGADPAHRDEAAMKRGTKMMGGPPAATVTDFRLSEGLASLHDRIGTHIRARENRANP
jgi:hypothetical protein